MWTFDFEQDLPLIERYNARRRPDAATRIQVQMGPAPFDGNPFKAAVLLLMNNPGWDEFSVPEDHSPGSVEWPIYGLSPQARPVYADWYKRPLGYLLGKYGKYRVSQKVAILQLNPWASQGFDLGLVLPSRRYAFDIANDAADRGAIIVIGRSFSTWEAALGSRDNVFRARNRRNPSLSVGGLGEEAFAAVERAVS